MNGSIRLANAIIEDRHRRADESRRAHRSGPAVERAGREIGPLDRIVRSIRTRRPLAVRGVTSERAAD